MATKPKKLTAKEKRIIRDRTILEWVLLVILLLLAYFFLAQSFKWWPYDLGGKDLGSAFYTSEGALKKGEDTTATPSGTGSEGSSSTNTGNSGSSNQGNSGNSGSNGSNGGTTTPATPATPANTPSILDLAARINTGTTLGELNVAANGINQKCTVVADTPALGKQSVCVYTQGNRTITATLLNDRVVSAALN